MTSEFVRSGYGVNWSYDQADARYREGRMSQDEWEAFCALHPHSAVGYGPPYANLEVARLIVAIRENLPAGRRLSETATTNVRLARQAIRVGAVS